MGLFWAILVVRSVLPDYGVGLYGFVYSEFGVRLPSFWCKYTI